MNKQEIHQNEEQDSEKVLADGPSKQNLKKIISDAKQKGYITQDQLCLLYTSPSPRDS